MPGKVNPVIPELIMQLSYRIRGSAATVEFAVAAGELELNVMEPVILDALYTMLGDLTDARTTFADKCIHGLKWEPTVVERHLSGSLHQSIEMAHQIGCDAAGIRRIQGSAEPDTLV